MFRSVVTLGVLGLVGVFALKFVLGTAVGLFFILISFAIKALVIGAVLYFIVALFSPDTMRRWRERWSRP